MRDGHGLIGVKPEPKMTLRDQFAMAALPVAAAPESAELFTNHHAATFEQAVANAAYRVADALLKAREEKPQ